MNEVKIDHEKIHDEIVEFKNRLLGTISHMRIGFITVLLGKPKFMNPNTIDKLRQLIVQEGDKIRQKIGDIL